MSLHPCEVVLVKDGLRTPGYESAKANAKQDPRKRQALALQLLRQAEESGNVEVAAWARESAEHWRDVLGIAP